MENKNYYTITIALLGAIKLVLDSFGIKIITNQNANDLANAIATLLTVAGVIMSHVKGKPDIKAFLLKIFKKKDVPAPVQKVVAQSVPVAKPMEQVQPIKQPVPEEATVQQPAVPTLTLTPSTQPAEQQASTAPNNTVQK